MRPEIAPQNPSWLCAGGGYDRGEKVPTSRRSPTTTYHHSRLTSHQCPKSKNSLRASAVKPTDCWNLASLFKSDSQWETAFKKWEAEIPRYAEFAGRLGESAKS